MPPTDIPFRILLALGLVIVVPILRYHRVRARTGSRALDRGAEGALMFFGLRAAAYAAFFSLLAYVIDPDWMVWSSLPIPEWTRWIGVVGGVVAASGLVVVLMSLGTNLTDTVVVRDHHTLVTTGPYRWVRHPFYGAFALGLASNALITANWFLALSGMVAIVLIVIRTRVEEQKLIERFGNQYVCYMQTTGRFFPTRLGPSPQSLPHRPPVVIPAEIR